TTIVVNTSVTPPTATISLAARKAGAVGNNITLGYDATTYDTTDFTSASFNPSVSGTTMTGGVDIDPGTTVYDAGTVTLSVAGFTATIDYGQLFDPSASEIVADLVNGIKSQLPTTNPPFSILVTNSTNITISFNSPGAQSATVTSSTTQTNYFSKPSFAACTVTVNPQSCSLSLGGTNPFVATVYDTGAVNTTVGGHTTPYQWSGSGSTAVNITQGVINAINADSAALVQAELVSSTSLKLTSKNAGVSTNYPAQVSVTFDTTDFTSSSFSASFSTTNLKGGADAVTNTVYDSGTAVITVNNHSDSAPWSGSGATASSIASALAVAVNSDSAAPVSASVGTDGVTITVTAKQGGIIGDYATASSLSHDGANFATPSFSVSNSGSMMIGGI